MNIDTMNLRDVKKEIKTYFGIRRKSIIPTVIDVFLPLNGGKNVIADYGEDAAVIDFPGGDYLLLAADGIMENLIEIDPYWAGYCSVLVNLHDVAAMGGESIALVNVLSVNNENVCKRILDGMNTAVRKFGIPIVGGHTHPDCRYNAIDVAVLGKVRKGTVILSSTAKNDEDIIFAMDIDGKFTPGIPYSWDTTYFKPSKLIRKQLLTMKELGERKLVTSGKDISLPGALGTLAMLLETSEKGGWVSIDKIPRPDNVALIQWLKAYQGCGFVLTTKRENSVKVIELFNSNRLTASVVGQVQKKRVLELRMGSERERLFDFEKGEGVTSLW